MRVAIIGCGPAGLAAAHAAKGLGCDVEVFSYRKMKSPLLGPLLLQRPIPGVTLTHPDGYIKQVVIGGTIIDYRYKLYGDINIAINGDVLERGYHAWKMHETYDRLWESYAQNIHEGYVGPDFLHELTSTFSLVVNTAPASAFCEDASHLFTVKAVAIRQGEAMEGQEPNSIYFNADKGDDWVRSSIIFGNKVTEYPLERAPEGHMVINKPINTTCNCHPLVFRTGRFGAWRNETWVDTAYYATREALIYHGG